MNKEIPCYIISDLLPLYQEDILSEQTKIEIDKHLKECSECKKKMDAMNMKMDMQPTKAELKENPLKKVRFYQKVLNAMGVIVAFFLGACYPIARLGFAVLERGEIATYQILRLKRLWYIVALKSCFIGIIACVIYVLLIVLIKKVISRSAA